MRLIDQLAEQRIAGAIAHGDLDALPGAGKPLRLEDESLVPEELRMAYRILKNAGMVPPTVYHRSGLYTLTEELHASGDSAEQKRIIARLLRLQLALESDRQRQLNLMLQEQYYHQVVQQLTRPAAE